MRFDLDDIGEWAPRLSVALEELVPKRLRERVKKEPVEWLEDALDVILENVERSDLIEATRPWLRGQTIVAYHGSRLSPEEIASVRAGGLIVLDPVTRRERLAKALCSHPRWAQVRIGLDAAIRDFGDGRFGRRQGQAHLTISRGALLTRTCFGHHNQGVRHDDSGNYSLSERG